MSLKGSLTEFSMADIFKMLGLTGKTGCLKVVKKEAEGSVYFREGKVFFAATRQNRVLLGVRLVEEGLVTPEQLSEGLAEQKSGKSSERLGQILIKRGHIDEAVLHHFVIEQIEDSLYQIFEWQDGDFAFAGDEMADEEDIGVYLTAEEVISEAGRWREEWKQIRKILPELDVKVNLGLPDDGEAKSLEPEEWRLVYLMDGKCTLSSLQKKAGMTKLGLCRVLAGMINKKLVVATSLDESATDEVSVEEEADEEETAAADQAGDKSEGDESIPAEWASYYERLYRQASVAKDLVKRMAPKK